VAPFRDYQEALDKEIVMAITSGQLTMLAESGSGTLAGGAHNETFMRVARALAKRISMAFQRQFDLEVLADKHPGQPPLAYFEILANEEMDVGEVVKDVKGLKEAGFVVDAGWLEEKTGYPVTVVVETVPGGGPALPNKEVKERKEKRDEINDPSESFLEAARAALGKAEKADFKPLADALNAALAGDEAGLMNRLKALREDLPKLAKRVKASAESVEAWEMILGAAMGNGLGTQVEEQS
jgi:phage gp29-like protein